MYYLNLSQRFCSAIMLAGLLGFMVGCGGADIDPRGMRVAAEGTVLVGDEPLSAAKILFISNEGDGVVRASALVKDGVFSFDPENGPLIGDARVEIHPVEIEMEELEAARGRDPSVIIDPLKVWIPPRYNEHSELTARLTENPENNQFEFNLVSN